jgi:hypothetical protein
VDSAKAVVSISEMARMVGLSRARFYQLIGTAVPWPIYDVATRRRNVGIDGKAILFYARRTGGAPMPMPKPKKAKPPKDDRHDELLDGLRSLGLTTATTAQVAEAVKELYPHGVDGTNHGEVLRTVFLHLRRRNSSDNVGG